MKTQLIALIGLLASSPAGASINISESPVLDIAPQPATYRSEQAVEPDSVCGEPRQMLFILRDPSGSIVAMGVAEMPATC